MKNSLSDTFNTLPIAQRYSPNTGKHSTLLFKIIWRRSPISHLVYFLLHPCLTPGVEGSLNLHRRVCSAWSSNGLFTYLTWPSTRPAFTSDIKSKVIVLPARFEIKLLCLNLPKCLFYFVYWYNVRKYRKLGFICWPKSPLSIRECLSWRGVMAK